ncbi:MAG: D-glycero-beta-D-manno-heptose 1,7-bisphosphate 7-phosphatase [Pseudomonadales bacterium]|jgi:D-glycero-D-manno-heptose 1,7-bisphosphate phosphatase
MADKHNHIVILDRDGVINEDSPAYIKHPDEWHPVEGSLEAIALMHAHGIRVYIATNQAGIAKGKLSESLLSAIHHKLETEVEIAGGKITEIVYCPHHPDLNCACRKPAPGMLIQILESTGVDPSEVYYVGDSLKDIEAAEAAGCRPVLVLTGNGQDSLKQRPRLNAVYSNLLAFVKDKILV